MIEFFNLKSKRVTVMGLGRFGGGVGAVKFLVDRGARVTVTDLLDEADLADSLAALDGYGLHSLHLGRHREEDFSDADLVVVSPAVPPDNRYVEIARHHGVPMTGETSLFWRFNRGRIIGVTGTNGKSTTAVMVHAMLNAAGFNGWLGGNIGRSLLPEVDSIAPDDWVVLELSSFQLHDLDSLPSSPNVAIVTNFVPNHLDWHGSVDEYCRAKQAILRWQTPEGLSVLNQDDDHVAGWTTYGKRLWFGTADLGGPGMFPAAGGMLFRDGDRERTFPLADWLQLPGRHNLQNAMAAACAAVAIGVPDSAIKEGLATVVPLPHRLEQVAEINGRRFFNDSLATTPESVVVALAAFADPVILMAGGYDKQVDLSLMADAIAERTKGVALMGQTAADLGELLAKRCPSHLMRECRSFDEAFGWACSLSSPGDVVLLSPGCASYDWFPNFAARGERFAELVKDWSGG
jgi:UDP-N-acetylmuramoylalanine--D-glutamate ligase